MTKHWREPPRLSTNEAAGPESLQSALREACDDVPDSEALQKLASTLGPAFTGAALGAASSAVTSGSSSSVHGLAQAGATASKGLLIGIGKGVTALAVTAACGVGSYHYWQARERAAISLPAPNRAAVTPPAARGVPAVETSTPLPDLGAPPHPSPLPENVAAQGSIAPLVTPPFERGSGSTGATQGRPVSAGDPATARLQTSAAAPPADSPAPLSEVELLQAARRSLTQNPAHALSLVAEHDQRFPQGQLAEEAAFIEIEGLKRLGRLDEAKARTERFHARYPSSLHGRTIDLPAR